MILEVFTKGYGNTEEGQLFPLRMMLLEENDSRFGSGQIKRRVPNRVKVTSAREKRGNSWQRECKHGYVRGEK